MTRMWKWGHGWYLLLERIASYQVGRNKRDESVNRFDDQSIWTVWSDERNAIRVRRRRRRLRSLFAIGHKVDAGFSSVGGVIIDSDVVCNWTLVLKCCQHQPRSPSVIVDISVGRRRRRRRRRARCSRFNWWNFWIVQQGIQYRFCPTWTNHTLDRIWWAK